MLCAKCQATLKFVGGEDRTIVGNNYDITSYVHKFVCSNGHSTIDVVESKKVPKCVDMKDIEKREAGLSGSPARFGT